MSLSDNLDKISLTLVQSYFLMSGKLNLELATWDKNLSVSAVFSTILRVVVRSILVTRKCKMEVHGNCLFYLVHLPRYLSKSYSLFLDKLNFFQKSVKEIFENFQTIRFIVFVKKLFLKVSD